MISMKYSIRVRPKIAVVRNQVFSQFRVAHTDTASQTMIRMITGK